MKTYKNSKYFFPFILSGNAMEENEGFLYKKKEVGRLRMQLSILIGSNWIEIEKEKRKGRKM